MGRPKLTDEQRAERALGKQGLKSVEKVLKSAAETMVGKLPENGNPQKLPGIFEVRRIGTYGFVFASFNTGIQFWVEFSKPTDRVEIIDLFDAHIEQRPWRMGSMDNNRRIPVWVWDKVAGLEFYHFQSGHILKVHDIERVKNEERSKAQGREFFEFYVIPMEGEKIKFRTGEGMFGQLKPDQKVPNVQDIKADGVRALWPNRTMKLDAVMKGSIFESMNMKPVSVPIDNSPNRDGELKAPEGTKFAEVKSGQMDRPIIGTYSPQAVGVK